MLAENILEYLNELYPESTALDFDNVGLLVGDYKSEVTKALVALDCTLKTVNNAVKNGCNLIITHHPVIFDPLKNVLKGSVVYELIKNNITVISMHTNLDVGKGGVNDCLCNTLGLNNIKNFTACDGFLLREGSISPISPKAFAEHIKATLGGNVRFADGGKNIEKVLVCSGSGGNYINEAILYGFDALVTSEVKHHQYLLAADNGVSIFDAGHFYSENVIVEPLKMLLSNHFKEIEFITDTNNNILCV